ncbi:protein kinase domain-containing protein [Janibacter sp. G56]|uniref:serine/threonine-protein kinase n=1 Tax=Janibacter sp. G56 TaxID=3418717 RepID=UPI003CFF3AC7
MDESPVVPGYTLLEVIGCGGSATVWRGRRDADGQAVAVKVVRPASPGGDADLSVGFEGALREVVMDPGGAGWGPEGGGEHLVRCHEAVPLGREAGDGVALILDLMEGGSLHDVVAARGHLSPGETVTVLVPLARALAALHRRGIVHGDVTPGNVLFDLAGRPALGDLGVARLAGEEGLPVSGTDGHIAPEVEAGAPPAPASDIHGLGVLGWLCLTGAPPGHITARVPLGELAPGTPRPLLEAIEACLDPSPGRRPDADAAALATFDAAPAEPLRLVLGEDAAAGLTHRIRAAAREPAPGLWDDPTPHVEPLPPTASERLAAGARRVVGHPRRSRAEVVPPTLARHPVGRGRRGARGRHRGASPRRRPRLSARAAAGLVGALACAVLTMSPGWGEGPTTLPSPGTEVSTPRSATGADTAVLRDPRAPRTDPVSVVRAIARARAEVMTTGDLSLAEELDAPGSRALRAHREELERLARSGARYEEVAFDVSAVSTRAADAERAVVRARVDLRGHIMVTADGRRIRRQPETAEPLDFVLRRVEGRWRLEDVLAVDPA